MGSIAVAAANAALLRNRARRRRVVSLFRSQITAPAAFVTLPTPVEVWAVAVSGHSGANAHIYSLWDGDSGTLVRTVTVGAMVEGQRKSLGVINAGLTVVPDAAIRLAVADTLGTLAFVTS